MSSLGLIHADVIGDIIRVARFQHEYAEARELSGVDATVVVALGVGDNNEKLRDIAENSRLYKIVDGVVKKGGATVSFDPGDDGHGAARFLDGLTPQQSDALRAGARAVITGLDANSTDVEKAIGYIALRIMRLEDR